MRTHGKRNDLLSRKSLWSPDPKIRCAFVPFAHPWQWQWLDWVMASEALHGFLYREDKVSALRKIEGLRKERIYGAGSNRQCTRG